MGRAAWQAHRRVPHQMRYREGKPYVVFDWQRGEFVKRFRSERGARLYITRWERKGVQVGYYRYMGATWPDGNDPAYTP